MAEVSTGLAEGVVKLTAQGDTVSLRLDIDLIKWVVPTGGTVGDLCEIKTTNGTTIFKSVVTVVGSFMDSTRIDKPVNGVNLVDLDVASEVYIYLRDRARSVRS